MVPHLNLFIKWIHDRMYIIGYIIIFEFNIETNSLHTWINNCQTCVGFCNKPVKPDQSIIYIGILSLLFQLLEVIVGGSRELVREI